MSDHYDTITETELSPAHRIAELIVNGNLSAARDAIIKGQTQHSAVVLALDVVMFLDEINPAPHADNTARVRRIITGGS